jgi:hypothetical protein
VKRMKYPYWEWEDYHAGLYALSGDGTQAQAKYLLSRPDKLEPAMHRATMEWPKAAEHHLSDDEVNGLAWLGWAACGITYRVPAHLTRAAWWTLTETERVNANAAAERVHRQFVSAYAQTLPF